MDGDGLGFVKSATAGGGVRMLRWRVGGVVCGKETERWLGWGRSRGGAMFPARDGRWIRHSPEVRGRVNGRRAAAAEHHQHQV